MQGRLILLASSRKILRIVRAPSNALHCAQSISGPNAAQRGRRLIPARVR